MGKPEVQPVDIEYIEKYVGKRIKEARKQKYKTQSEFADALGVNSVTVSRWETGARFPGLKMLDALASWFEVPITYFFENENYIVKCCDCGALYGDETGLDITLPDDQWEKITRDGCNILCGGCIAKRASELFGAVYISAKIKFVSDIR